VPWTSAACPEEAFLLVVHFCYYGSGNEGRRYYHRFMTLRDDLTPSRIGKIFSLCDDQIQYVAGLAPAVWDRPGKFVMTYGVGDSQAWGVEVDSGVIEESLVYKF
jgi:hypothetical protein